MDEVVNPVTQLAVAEPVAESIYGIKTNENRAESVNSDRASWIAGAVNQVGSPENRSNHNEIQVNGASPRASHPFNNISLNVMNLFYVPMVDYYSNTLNAISHNLSKYNIRFEKLRSVVKYAPLNGVSFRADGGKVHAILSNNPAEQNSLVELIVGNRKTGEFMGDILLSGLQLSNGNLFKYMKNVAFIPHKTLYIPGLTYIETLRYAARLQLSGRGYNSSSIENRVAEILDIMDLTQIKSRVVPEFPENRGEAGRDMRLLSIALQIVSLPALIVIDDPVLELDAGVAAKIFKCLYRLAERGHIILCSMPKPNPSLVQFIDNLIVLSEGYTIYASSVKNVERFFSSKDVGYILRKDVEIIDFILDVASGVERPELSRQAETAQALHEKFELSPYYETPLPGIATVSVFSTDLFLCFGYARLDYPITLLLRTLVVIDRAFVSKFKDVETIKRSLGSSIVLSCVIGYIQLGQGSYGYYTMTLLKFPYLGTANITALLFFVNAFVFAQQVLNVHVICQKLQVFRYEQALKYCTSLSFFLATALSEIPFTALYAWIFSTIIYFMSDLNNGIYNYFYFNVVLVMIGIIGLGTALMFSTIFLFEYQVRDLYLVSIFLMVLLSGFPFQIPEITSYMDTISRINPFRWSFEALMEWKFNSDHYHDGSYYLEPFGADTYTHDHIFTTLGYFIIFSWSVFFILSLPFPVLLKRINQNILDRRRSQSLTLSMDSRDSFDKKGKDLPKIRASELVKPLIFARDSSVSQKSKLSLSVTPFGEESSSRGPTVAFLNVSLRVRDRRSPMGYKTILNNVSGQFDWGKLSIILGASQSGKSSLLHTLAGDVGLQTTCTGDIFYNGRVPESSKPLWQRCALVEAHDEQYRDLTVKDVITFAMKLRCANRRGFSVVEENVKATVEILHLDSILNQRVKALTRGERRRLSIAEEIVHGPSLLFIDEPTTHLDALDESVMMMTFRELVNQDKTVVTTSYQPTPASFTLFDTILILSKGRVIYHGNTTNAIRYFIACPSQFNVAGYSNNPGDFLVDISSSQLRDAQGNFVEATILESYYMESDPFKSLLQRLDKLKAKAEGRYSLGSSSNGSSKHRPNSPTPALVAAAAIHNPIAADSNSANGDMSTAKNDGETDSRKESFDVETANTKANARLFSKMPSSPTLTFLYQSFMGVVVWKGLINRWKLLFGSVLLYILLACIFGWIIGDASTQVYNSASFFAVGPLLVFICNVLFIYYVFKSNEVFLKENSRGLYTNFTHWLVANIPLYILQIINGIIYSAIVYKLLNMNTDASIYKYFYGLNVISFLASFLMSEFIIYSVGDIRSAYLIIPGSILIQFAFSGLFIKTNSLPGWLSPWAPSCSMIRWCLEGNFMNQFQSSTVFPTVNGFSTYEAFLDLFAWQGDNRWTCAYNMLYFALAFKVGALVSNGIVALYQKGGRNFKRIESDW